MLKKLWAHIVNHKGWYIICAMVVFGTLMYGVGKALVLHFESFSASIPKDAPNAGAQLEDLTKKATIWKLVSGVGGLISASGISSAVLKIIAMEGFFLDAVAQAIHGEKGRQSLREVVEDAVYGSKGTKSLSEAVAGVVYGPAGLESLPENRLQDAWLFLMREVYLKNMRGDGASQSTKFAIEDMRTELEKALQARIPSFERHFVNHSNRTLEVEWLDAEKSVIQIRDTVVSDTIPFNCREEMTWKTKVIAESGQRLEDDQVLETELKLIDEEPNVLTSVQDRTAEGDIITTYTAPPREKYRMRRARVWKQRILDDPNFYTISPFIVKKFTVNVTNRAKGLRIIANPLGNTSLLEMVSGKNPCDENEILYFESKRMLLAEQGYVLTFLKTAT